MDSDRSSSVIIDNLLIGKNGSRHMTQAITHTYHLSQKTQFVRCKYQLLKENSLFIL